MKNLFYSFLEIIILFIFVSIIPLSLIYDGTSSFVWTILIPLIPIAIILMGFSNWRNICPLAFFSKISQKINWIEKRKVPLWFEENFYYFQYALLFIAFSLRFTTLNYDNTLLGVFFVFIIISSFLVNLIFTGKSWCNFFCPVGVVERIYTLSNAKNYMSNSACYTCTACKKYCPDIDMENNYWREGSNKQKTFVFYSFAGLILGFYSYFYLYSGNFEFYFSGDWTDKKLSFLSSGFFFAPWIPVVIAAPFTLASFSYLSFFIFKKLENYFWKNKIFKNATYETLLHKVKAIASFMAFNIFYIFAGVPSYMDFETGYSVFYFIIVVSSSIIFYKEIFREESFFIQERFALKVIKRWKSTKEIPANLKEIYYSYVHEEKNRNNRLKVYRKTVRDLMQEGILNDGSMVILEKLREQIGVSKDEHLSAMKNLKLKNQELFDSSIEKSSEQKYQRKSYTKVIENALKERSHIETDYLKSLQREFCISDEIHKKIMDDILNTNDKHHLDILDLLDKAKALLELNMSIFNDNSREILFLKHAIQHEFTQVSKDLFSLLFLIYKEHKETLRILLNISKDKIIDENFTFCKDTLFFMDDKISSKIMNIKKKFDFKDDTPLVNNNHTIITQLLSHTSVKISFVALLNMSLTDKSELDKLQLDKFSNSKDKLTLELLLKIKNKTDNLTTIERMMYLNAIELFVGIRFNDLEALANVTKVLKYSKDEYVLKKGEVGNTLFIILHGQAESLINNKQISILTDKDYFGEISILGDIKRAATVRTLSDVVILSIQKKDFKEFLYENPKVSTKVMKAIIKKLTNIQE